jgi:hypothetical protein
MFVVSYRKTMENAKRVVPDDEPPPRSKRFNELAAASLEWERKKRERESGIPEPGRISNSKPHRIIERVAAEHGVTSDDILGRSRRMKVIAARSDAIAAVYTECRIRGRKYTMYDLGRTFNRDHETVRAFMERRGLL